jgi:Mn-containing catalase
MFVHNKRLQYTVRDAAPSPGLVNLLQQFGGPQGELAAACRTSLKWSAKMIRVAKTCCSISLPKS